MSRLDKSLLWGGLIRVLAALAVIVPAAFYATRWYGRRQAPSKHLRIEEALSLGANKSLYVIEWEKRRLLLGVTNQAITLLDEKSIEPAEKEDGGD